MALSMGLLGAASFVAPAGSYDLLQTEILTGAQASVTFSSLGDYAADYQHLQLRILAQEVNSLSTLTALFVRFNGDSGNNYAWHRLNGDGSSVTSSAATSSTQIQISDVVPRSNTAGVWGAIVADILDPFEPTKNTTFRSLSGGLTSGESDVNLNSGLWNNTAAVSSIYLSGPAANLSTGCRFSLYGLRK
jgi:hypothetical protein